MTEKTAPISKRAQRWVPVVVLVAAIAAVAWARMGILGLPSVPADTTAESAGLANLDAMRQLDEYVRAGEPAEQDSSDPPSDAARLVAEGIRQARSGDALHGLELMRAGLELEPDNLVFCNAYRMEVFQLQREFLSEATKTSVLAPDFPPHLAGQPVCFLEELAKHHPARETRLSLALAWVDLMLLFPALEIKAPASVEAVDILTEIIEDGGEYYVPALFARGLNHLHRPSRLVWPETRAVPPDAAANDIARCVAVGRAVEGGSDHLRATLAMTLGDAFVKAGEYGRARSWWQIAQNLCRDEDIQDAVRRRYAWRDEEILDRLELELDRARGQIVKPMTDLAFMWD